jgi:hypothetical protein
MKVAVGMGLGSMMYVPRFIKIGLGVQKLIGRDTQTLRQGEDRIRLLEESRLKRTETSVCK